MEENLFNQLADAELARLEERLEKCGVDLDVEAATGGMLEISFEDGAQIVIHVHRIAQEIWLAGPGGAYHFRPEAQGRWVSAREGAELYALLAQFVSKLAHTTISFGDDATQITP